jgi:hypothetical protein
MKAILFYGKVVCLLLSLSASGFAGYYLGFHDQAEHNRRAHIENYRVGLYTGLKEAYRRHQAGETLLDPVQPATTPALSESLQPIAAVHPTRKVADSR